MNMAKLPALTDAARSMSRLSDAAFCDVGMFDVALPCDLRGQEKILQAALEAALNDLGEGTYYTVITFDQAAFN